MLVKVIDTKYYEKWGTGKSLSEALTFASTNPQYDNRFSLNYKFKPGENMLCTEIVFEIQNRLANKKMTTFEFGHFKTIFGHFFANYIYIFHKTEVLMVILRG